MIRFERGPQPIKKEQLNTSSAIEYFKTRREQWKNELERARRRQPVNLSEVPPGISPEKHFEGKIEKIEEIIEQLRRGNTQEAEEILKKELAGTEQKMEKLKQELEQTLPDDERAKELKGLWHKRGIDLQNLATLKERAILNEFLTPKEKQALEHAASLVEKERDQYRAAYRSTERGKREGMLNALSRTAHQIEGVLKDIEA